MKKIIGVLALFNIVLILFFSCQTEASSPSDTPPVKQYNVTVIPNGAAGLTQEVYPVDEGKSLTALSNMPTMTSATLTGYTYKDSTTPYELGVTPVNSDITIVMQWKWKDFNCTGKTDTLVNYIESNNAEGISCTLGTDIDAENIDLSNLSAFLYAAAQGKTEALKYLHEVKGAALEQKNFTGYTPLLLAISKGNVDAIKYLVFKGANLTAKTDKSNTAVILAASVGQLEILKYLINKGASVTDRNVTGATPLLYAARVSSASSYDLMQYLLSLPGVSINEKDNDGMTPLMTAVDANSENLTKFFATYTGVSLKEKVTASNNIGADALGLDALGLALRKQAAFKADPGVPTNSVASIRNIIDYLTPLWK